MTILAIDPGNNESAFVIIGDDLRPIEFAKEPNRHLLEAMRAGAPERLDLGPAPDRIAIEMVESFGMSVGASVFETCVWIGRFAEAIHYRTGREPLLITRKPIKMHFCNSTRAKDSNIKQALVDRFAPDDGNHGKGTKTHPGWFYGFSRDVWQAYALAVYLADNEL